MVFYGKTRRVGQKGHIMPQRKLFEQYFGAVRVEIGIKGQVYFFGINGFGNFFNFGNPIIAPMLLLNIP